MPLGGESILVVEDESMVAFDLGCIVHKARGKVAGYATSLSQAMRLAETADLSLAILDYRLGSHTSLPVAAKLYAAGVPFIFHTGCGISELSVAWPLAPIVEKPATPKDLVAAMVALLCADGDGCSSRDQPGHGGVTRALAAAARLAR